MSSARLLSFILPALCCSSLSAHAADAWSLSNLVGHALAHHPALRSAGHAVRAEQARSLGAARWSVACGLATALLLTATVIDTGHGLTQRLGLGITDVWIVVVALGISSGRFGRT